MHSTRYPLCLGAQSCPTLCDPTDYSPPGSVHGDSPGKSTGIGCHFLLQGSSQPMSSALQMDSLLTEPPAKPRPPLPDKYWPASYSIVALGPGGLKPYGLKGKLFLARNNRSSQGFTDRLTATMTFQGR